jgi:AcrR family transcriptional regulator
VRAARQVFSELGYDAATFQEIAVRADLTRPAINHYFKSKRVLYQVVVERTSELIVAHSVQKASEAKTLLAQLDTFIDAAVGADLDERSAAAFLVTSVMEAQRHPELRQEDHDALLATRQFLTWAISGAIDRGELTTNTPVEPLVEMLTAMLWGVAFYAGFVGGHDDLKNITDEFKRLLVGKLWDWQT